MTFTVAPTFEGPSGDPARLAAAATQLMEVAQLLDGVGSNRRFSIAEQIGFLSEHRDSFIWEGAASNTFGQFIDARTEGCQTLATNIGRGALALAELAESISNCQKAVAVVATLGQERAAVVNQAAASQVRVPITSNALFGDLYGMVSNYEGIAEAAKEEAAETFNQLFQAAPNYVAPTPKPKPGPKDNPWWKKALKGTHVVLDVAGQVPVIGEPANLIDAGIYLAEGDEVNAGISASGAVPLVGNVTTGARMAKRVDGVVDVVRHADDVGDAARRVDDIPTSGIHGGAGEVPPVAGTGDAGFKWPKRRPQQPGRRGGQPEPGAGVDPNPTGFDRTPVEDEAQDLATAIRLQQLRREAAANPQNPRPSADA